MSSLAQRAPQMLGRHAPALKRLVPPQHRSKAWAMFFHALPTAGKTATFARWFRGRAGFCRNQGSPLYAELLEVAARDIEQQGSCWAVLATYANDNELPPAATPLAFMAAVHHVVLNQRGSALEPFYPSLGGDPARAGLPEAFLEVVSQHRAELQVLLRRPVQTNEVGRSRALIGGFLTIADATQLPLRILEFGASAGLNLRWDHYRYDVGDASWGDPDSPVRLVDGFVQGVPPLHLTAEVAQRRGSDLSPIDPCSSAGQAALLSHVWADQTDRIERLRGAFDVAAAVDVNVERADAADWVEVNLRTPTPELATVLYDTCVMEYLDPMARERIRHTIESAGAKAGARQPLAWLHLTPGRRGGEDELHLTTWPGGSTRLLATTDPYGRSVHWHGPH